MPRLLLVEDEPAIADTLVYALGTECFEVTHALTGADALAAAEREKFDFAILDIGLPDMTGYDVAKRMRLIPSMQKTLLVALTGWGTQDDRQRTRDAGFDRHLTKPAELPAVEELLRTAEQAKRAAA